LGVCAASLAGRNLVVGGVLVPGVLAGDQRGLIRGELVMLRRLR